MTITSTGIFPGHEAESELFANRCEKGRAACQQSLLTPNRRPSQDKLKAPVKPVCFSPAVRADSIAPWPACLR